MTVAGNETDGFNVFGHQARLPIKQEWISWESFLRKLARLEGFREDKELISKLNNIKSIADITEFNKTLGADGMMIGADLMFDC